MGGRGKVNTTVNPFNLVLEPRAFQSFRGAKEIVRRLSDMTDLFSDEQAIARALANDDPIIYRFWEVEHEGSDRELSFGLTFIYPGRVGREYHMTKGHFHTTDGDEIYVVMRGQGLLLLQTRAGEAQTLEMSPGHLCYVLTGWAHRTVNTGDDDLVFLSIWPPNIEHDYETVAQNGFPQIVVDGTDGPLVINNPSFSRRLHVLST